MISNIDGTMGGNLARINFEEAIYKDIRFIQLIQKLGSLDTAIGALVRAWTLAQAHYLTTVNDRLIPLFEWKRQQINDAIIEVGLAEKREKGIYVCGAEKQFGWLIQRQEAGLRSVERRREKNIVNPINEANDRSTTVNDRSAPLNPVNGSEPLSLSLSHSLKEKNLKANSREKREPPPGMGLFIATYAKAWERRWGSRPDLRGKVQGQIKTFLKDMPIERACELIQVYCQMEEQWFVTKCHDFGTFLENIGKVNIALDTGQAPGAKSGVAEWLAEKQQLEIVR